MGRILLTLSAASLLYMSIGSVIFPDDVFFWLGSGSDMFLYVRGVMMIFLVVHILSNPPRYQWFRIVSGAVGMCVLVWTLQATYAFKMPMADMFAFLASSTALLVATLEGGATASCGIKHWSIQKP